MLYRTKEQYRLELIEHSNYVDMKLVCQKLDLSFKDYRRFIEGKNEVMSPEDLDLIVTGLTARPILSNLDQLLMLKKITDQNKINTNKLGKFFK